MAIRHIIGSILNWKKGTLEYKKVKLMNNMKIWDCHNIYNLKQRYLSRHAESVVLMSAKLQFHCVTKACKNEII